MCRPSVATFLARSAFQRRFKLSDRRLSWSPDGVGKAQRYFDRRAHKKCSAEARRLLLGLVGAGVRAANQAASVVRAACTVHRTSHADRTLVGPDARLVLMMTCVVTACLCKCERA